VSLFLIGYIVYDFYRSFYIHRRHKEIDGILGTFNETCKEIAINAEKISVLSKTIHGDALCWDSVKQIQEIANSQVKVLNEFLRINNDLINAIYSDLGFIKRKLTGH
jgi:hypothetical protein